MSENSISNGFGGIFHIWREEMKKIFRDEGIILFFIVVPLLYPLLYSSLYTTEVVRELPVAVVDDSNSSLSREYIRKVDATPDVEIIYQSTDLKSAQELMREEKIYGIIYIPNDFSKNIIDAEEQAHVSVFSDMASFFYYGAIVTANTEVSLEMNKKIKIKRLGNATEKQEEIQAAPIAYEHIMLFNSQNGFAASVIPAVLILILHQTLILGIGLRAGTEREHNRFNDLVAVQKHHTETFSLIVGKAMAYFMIYLLNAAYVLFVTPWLFGLPQIGHIFDILAFLFPFLTATVFFAMTLSTLVRNRETVIILFVFSSIPLLFLSGISWPSVAISPFWKTFSYLFPSTLGVDGFVRLNTMGAHLHQVSFPYIGLWLQAAFYFLTTFIAYRRETVRSRLHIRNRLEELRGK